MGNIVENIALGRIVELVNRVNSNDPANSALILVPLSGTETDANAKDVDTLTALLATSLDELSANGWNRKTLTDASSVTATVSDASDNVSISFPDPTWTTVTTGTSTRIAICYDNDTTGGTDANIVPLILLDMAVVPSGGDITLNVNAAGVEVIS